MPSKWPVKIAVAEAAQLTIFTSLRDERLNLLKQWVAGLGQF